MRTIFHCGGCGSLITAVNMSTGETLNCPECRALQEVPDMEAPHAPSASSAVERATSAAGTGIGPRTAPRGYAGSAASAPAAGGPRYPVLASLSAVYTTLAILGIVSSLVVGVFLLVQEERQLMPFGFMTIGIGIFGSVSALAAAEGIKWMIDVEEHLRHLRHTR